MKDERNSPCEEPGGTRRQGQSQTAARLPMIRTIMATLAILTQGLNLESKAQSPLPPDLGNQAAPIQQSSLPLLVEQRRQHPSYQIFAGQLALPVTTIVDETTLEIGGKMKIDVRRLDQVTLPQRETLAGQFEVPVGVVDKLWASLSNSVPADAAQMAGKLRTTVIDYKFLLERWTQYRPPTGKETVKADALLALQGGEVNKAWGLYVALPRLKAPGGLRITGKN